jgi:hypothetical protein
LLELEFGFGIVSIIHPHVFTYIHTYIGSNYSLPVYIYLNLALKFYMNLEMPKISIIEIMQKTTLHLGFVVVVVVVVVLLLLSPLQQQQQESILN